MRTFFRFLLLSTLIAAVGAVGATAVSAASKKKKPLPEITSISPRSLKVGEKLTIRGKNFRSGPLKNSVGFYRKGRPIVFIKAEKATSKKITVTVSTKVLTLFKDNQTKARTIKLRILAYRLGKKWTPTSRSVKIDPVAKAAVPNPGGGGGGGGGGGPLPPTFTCEERAAFNGAGDEDKDLISNAIERLWGTNPCLNDTDGDSISDGYEALSSADLNFTYGTREYTTRGYAQLSAAAPPFNGRRYSQNPLDGTDADKDFDGDGLTMRQEYAMWVAAGTPFPQINYSDGLQQTIAENAGSRPWLDLNNDGTLTDEEKDFDGDNLSNYVEFNTTGTQAWWAKVKWLKPRSSSEYISELPYSLRNFVDLDATNRDTDGDTVIDGDDDQDNDGWSNLLEMQYSRFDTRLRTHPFNPCMPELHAITCSRTGLLEQKAWPPYDGDSSTPPTVLPGSDYEVVRWPYDEVDGNMPNLGDNHPLNTTLWDGRTGFLP
jgi:hypothetical protein